MAALTRFEELFGDESFNFSTTPELVDVSPGLISTDSKYASKELNQRRQAVTGRSFRSPVPRSMNPRQTIAPQQSESEPEPEWIPSNRKGPTDPGLEGGGPGGGGAFGPEGASGQYLIEQQGDTGRLGAGTLGNEIGDSLVSSLGTMGVMGATTATLGALSMGAPSSMIPGIATGSFVSSALNPIALANIVGGGLYAGQTGYNAGQEISAQGYGLTDQGIQNASIAAFNAINPGIGGIAELGAEGLLSMLGIGMSPSDTAAEAASQEAQTGPAGRLAAMQAAEYGGSAVGPDNGWGGTDSGLVGPGDTNADISAAFGVSPDVSTTAPTGNIAGTGGQVSQALQSFGFGGTSGTMGVGPGGLTEATGPNAGTQQGMFGPRGFNPHASDMDIKGAPTPTVGGSQGHGVGQTGNVSTGTIGGYQGGHSGDPDSGPGGGGGGKG